MELQQVVIGARVRSLVDFCGVPKGTEGVIDEDYGSGFVVAWDLPGRPLPPNYKRTGRGAAYPGEPLRDGFGKDRELAYLEVLS